MPKPSLRQSKAANTADAVPLLRKGDRTRQRIVDAVEEILRTKHLGELKIAEVARRAHILHSNFYNYFSGIEEVLLTLAEQVLHVPEALVPLIEQDWRGKKGVDYARVIVETYLESFETRGAVFKMVNMLADDPRSEFARIRLRYHRPIYKALEKKIAASQRAGRISGQVVPRAAAYEVIGILAILGQKEALWLDSGFTREQLIETTSRTIHALVTGRFYVEPDDGAVRLSDAGD